MTRDKIDSGVPRPYASTTLPTPRQVFNRIVSPFRIWEALVFAALFTVIGLLGLIWVAGETYSSTLISVGGLFATLAVGLGAWTDTQRDVRDVPSITDVTRTVEYVRAASRLSVLTIIGGVATVGLLLVSHLSEAFFIIDDSTRLAVVLLVALAVISSYVIVRTLCSYSPSHSKTSLSLPVEVSSIPEIVTVLGFVVSPALVIFAGLIYNGPPIVMLPFSVTLVDAVAIIMAILFLYVAAVSRL